MGLLDGTGFKGREFHLWRNGQKCVRWSQEHASSLGSGGMKAWAAFFKCSAGDVAPQGTARFLPRRKVEGALSLILRRILYQLSHQGKEKVGRIEGVSLTYIHTTSCKTDS